MTQSVDVPDTAARAVVTPLPRRRRAAERARRLLLDWLGQNQFVIAYLALFIWASISAGNFLTGTNLLLILTQSAPVVLVVVPSTLLLMAGHVDLSVGSVLGLTAVVSGALFPSAHNWAPFIGVAAGLSVGVFNGYLSAYRGMSPIIVTLGTLTGIAGVSFVVSGGLPTYNFGPGFSFLGGGNIIGIPFPILVAGAALLVGSVLLYQTVWGRYIEAIGVNSRAAFLAGINVVKIPFFLYVVTAFAASFAGLINMSQLDSAPPTLGQGFEIQVLTAILLGGVAFGGGGGSMFGVLVGVLFLTTLNNGLILNNVSPLWTQVFQGGALVFAAAINVLRVRRRRRANADEGPPAPQLKVGVKT